ncbi:MAG: STAS domain-containing protein [Nitrospirota bacterium]|nr:STAS domain-containing protein [Nitrospirota bacterium]
MKVLGNSSGVLVAPADMTIRLAAELAADLLSALKGKKAERLELKASDVEHIDTAALQVLLSAKRSAREQGREFVITNPSQAFRETAVQLGLDTALLES